MLFSCDCLNGDFLDHTFTYNSQRGDTYNKIAWFAFANLTTADWILRVNTYISTRVSDNAIINVTVNCLCGDRSVLKNYGLFATYPLRPDENISYVAVEFDVPAKLLQMYNPRSDLSVDIVLVFVPAIS